MEGAAAQYIPPQNCGIAHMPLFDFKSFSVFAENYEITGKDIAAACENNSTVAWKMGRYRTSQTWKIIALLFDSDDDDEEGEEDENCSTSEQNRVESGARSEDEEKHVSTEHENEQNHILQDQNSQTTDDGSEDENLERKSESGSYLDKQASNPEEDKESSDTESSTPYSEHTELWASWQHRDVVMGLLDYYTEQGDVQMCVTIYLILEAYLHVDEYRLEDWFTAYIDLLHRFKLWSTATAVIKACKIQRVRERNEAKSNNDKRRM
ncbi:WD repeat-containing protein 24 [Apophysomyces sp. BC1034]|nr:WD repeat-containing protein 24 [Apophysomyces sp. BC1021]KAG0184766.1 WD repeat-containing protein 24 [Apophysomyces sp. BC1034]